jgi:hypothetical protein
MISEARAGGSARGDLIVGASAYVMAVMSLASRSRMRLGALTITWLALSAAASCDDEPSALSQLGDGCRLNSDCNPGLVCVSSVCHVECNTSEDCQGGRCVLGEGKLRLCQPDSTASCTLHSDCDAPLVCGVDGKCRNECASDRDCVSGQRCVAATCAEVEELDDLGQLPLGGDPVGKPCRYSSQCPATNDGNVLECREGRCAYACFEARDCPLFYTCSSTSGGQPGAGEPGDCVLIGERGSLFCDPQVDPCPGDPPGCACDCPGGMTPMTQQCRPDGSGLEDCPCP